MNTAAIGHNIGAFNPAEIEEFETRVRDFSDAAGEWLDLGEISTEEQAQNLNDYINGTRKLTGEIEKARKAAKEPHIEAGKAVDAAYNPLMTPLTKAVQKAKLLLTAWAEGKAAKERAEREKALAEARAQKEAEERRAREAEARNDVMEQARAEERLKAAEKAEKQAMRDKPLGQVASASGAGRTAALRTYYEPEIVSIRSALIWFLDKDPAPFAELLLRMAAAEKRANREIEIPGVKFNERKAIA